VIGNLLAFAIAAVLEIAGCFAFWAWLRRGASPTIVVVGIASLVGFAIVLTRVESAFAGRAYAAYPHFPGRDFAHRASGQAL
jgi:small multidrug resistance family-3 protein